MACCGKNRPVPQADASSAGPAMPSSRTPTARYFEYIGKTGLTVIGPVTGRRYRFERPGAVLAIDERDGPSMVGVPNLRGAPTPE